MNVTRRHWPRYVAALVMSMVLAGAATAFATIQAIPLPEIPTVDSPEFSPLPPMPPLPGVEPGQPQTLLLIGSDKRSTRSVDGGRTGELSDTMMLARLDGDRGGALLSIPRDTQVQIPLKGGGSRTAKINEAFAEGGAPLAVRVVRSLLGLPINHVVVINFSAFERAINKLGCLYQDIDRTYFNDNSDGGENYATIDVKAGYQLLCGADTLDWVRYRHADSDLVRAARQQEFLRAAKSQIATSALFDNRKGLLEIFGRYTRTDITSRTAVLSLLKLALNASDDPLRSVKFRAVEVEGTSNLATTARDRGIMRREFQLRTPAAAGMTPGSPPRTTPSTTPSGAMPDAGDGPEARPARRTPAGRLATGLTRVPSEAEKPELTKASFDLAGSGLPMYYPGVRLAVGGYATRGAVRTYRIRASRFSKRTYPAFRLTFGAGEGKYFGQFYGLQGTSWKEAPILREPHAEVRHRGRTLKVFSAGGRTRIVAWVTDDGAFWISNSVSLALGNRQMLDMAASLVRVPG